MNIKEIIQQLRVTMDDAKGQDSHFDSWLTQNEGICKAIDALKILDTQPLPVQEPVACRFCFSEKGCWTWQCYHCGEIDDVQKPAPPQQQAEPVKLRRGDILRCIETDELCTVWSTSTTGKTLIKWSANNFGNYTAAQIGELFWIEPREAEPVTWDKPSASFDEWWDSDRRRDTANPFTTDSFAYWAFEGWQAALAQRPWQGLTDEEIFHAGPRIGTSDSNVNPYQILINARAIEAKLKERNI